MSEVTRSYSTYRIHILLLVVVVLKLLRLIHEKYFFVRLFINITSMYVVFVCFQSE